jgi:hypothetical protein
VVIVQSQKGVREQISLGNNEYSIPDKTKDVMNRNLSRRSNDGTVYGSKRTGKKKEAK